jgi:hypothetical protein
VAVPPLIDQATFDAVQAHLRARNPKVTPARVASGGKRIRTVGRPSERTAPFESTPIDLRPLFLREKSDFRARGTSGSKPLPATRHGSTLSPRRLAALLSPCETALRREQRQRHSRFLFRFWLLRLFSFAVGSPLPFCHNTVPYVDHPGSKIYPNIIRERFRICSANLKSSTRCGAST